MIFLLSPKRKKRNETEWKYKNIIALMWNVKEELGKIKTILPRKKRIFFYKADKTAIDILLIDIKICYLKEWF